MLPPYPERVARTRDGYGETVAMAPSTMRVTLDGRDVRLTNVDRVLWPELGLTKSWLLQSYLSLAPTLLPHLRGHPITMWRYPQGVDHEGWWQNECRGAPEWVNAYRYRGTDGREHRHCVIDDVSSLMWLVNLGTIEIHPFPFTVEDDGRPRWLVFDLDPGEPAGLREACVVATALLAALDGQSLTTYLKTSGVKGLHAFVPLNGTATFEQAKSYARTVASVLTAELPGLVVDRQARSLRSGRVLVDWLQNDRFRSTVAPYSLRATMRPQVSTPVRRDEVMAVAEGEAPETSLVFGVEDVLARIEERGDPFVPVLEVRQPLEPTTRPG
jgi:bifunctional non-homologous end joining protein LigD